MFSLAIVIMAERSRELQCGPMPLEPLEGTRLYLSVAVSSHTPGMMGDLIPGKGPNWAFSSYTPEAAGRAHRI